MGTLTTLFPNLVMLQIFLVIALIIFGAIAIQIFVQYSDQKWITFLVPSAITIFYFFLVCTDVTTFGFATILFLLVQAMYLSMWYFKKSI